MNEKLPRITPTELIKAIKKLGFEESRTKGSHKIYKNQDKTKRIVIPFHRGKTIHPKIIKDISRITNTSLDDFLKLL